MFHYGENIYKNNSKGASVGKAVKSHAHAAYEDWFECAILNWSEWVMASMLENVRTCSSFIGCRKNTRYDCEENLTVSCDLNN